MFGERYRNQTPEGRVRGYSREREGKRVLKVGKGECSEEKVVVLWRYIMSRREEEFGPGSE